ncbi:MAG TPA: phosphonate ABC transporter, permease protein PhnE [Burkholderiaceae bacterium]
MSEAPPRQWRRYSPRETVLRLFVWLCIAAATAQALRTIEIIPEFLVDAPAQMHDMAVRMWPIDWPFYWHGVHRALVETLHIATLGTLLAVLLALPFALLAARNITPWRSLNFFARVVLAASRSVNSLVWALLFVAVFGPGAAAGTLAIAFRSIGFLGRMAGDALEQMPRGPVEALQAAGAARGAQLYYGYWPQLKPSLLSIALLRWDINVRESAVLGLVGAGGVGMALDTALNQFQWPRVALVLACVFAVVVAIELGVTLLRRRLL